jgi:alcohol dehydrogenase
MLSSSTFTLTPGPTTVFGLGTSLQLHRHLPGGTENAFVVTDPGVVDAGLVGPIVDALVAAGVRCDVFDGVEPNPTDLNVDAGLKQLRAFGDAVVVLVGGGSAMDCGKCIAIAGPNEGRGIDYAFAVGLGQDDRIDFSTLASARRPERAPYPTVAIPTTSGTASETNGGGLITDTESQRKLTFSSDAVKPGAVLLDPGLTVGLPPGATASCGMDALTHAIEAFTSQRANAFADALALRAIELVRVWLPRAVEHGDDLEARANMLVASHLSGLAFSSGPLLGLVHATGHPLSARFHAAHGQTLATMLPHVMRFNREVCAERYARVGTALGTEADPDAAIAAVEAISAEVGTDASLADLGCTVDHLDELTQDALSDLIILTTPRYPTRTELRSLYASALA